MIATDGDRRPGAGARRSAAIAAPAAKGCDNRTNNTYEKLLECVTVDGVLEH